MVKKINKKVIEEIHQKCIEDNDFSIAFIQKQFNLSYHTSMIISDKLDDKIEIDNTDNVKLEDIDSLIKKIFKLQNAEEIINSEELIVKYFNVNKDLAEATVKLNRIIRGK